MKKAIITFLFLSLLLQIGSFGVKAHDYQLSVIPISDLQTEGNKAIVSFAELGYDDTELVSPYDSTNVFFTLPSNWELTPSAVLTLDVNVFLSGSGAFESTTFAGTLSISFNNILIATQTLREAGSQSFSIPIPAVALISPFDDGRHRLSILLSAQFGCYSDLHSFVTIKNTSSFELPFQISPPALDLSQLPSPFFRDRSLVQEKTMVVVPDNPEPLELNAALNLLVGLGSMIDRDTYDIPLISSSQLTDVDTASNHLIFVGKPDKFNNQLQSVNFPLPIANGEFVGLPPASADDGILQMAMSPWNETKAIMLVSGLTGEAVAKAGQAVSTDAVLTFDNSAITYVSDVKLLNDAVPFKEDFTLHDLGYVTETLSGIGNRSIDYDFTITKSQVSAEDAYFDLLYYHSGVIDASASSLSVYLNDQIISSVVFEESSETVTTRHIVFPPGLLKYGQNRISIRAELQPEFFCDTTGFSNPWVTIVDQSRFHLPAGATDTIAPSPSVDLKFFPNILLRYSDLGDIALVLPKVAPQSWNIAGRLAYYLGYTASPLISNLKMVFSDDVSQEIRANNTLVLIGKPDDLPFLEEINDDLPAPFDFSNNAASERQLQVVYRIPPGVSVGYLELMPSPFNSEKTILVIAGNTDNGLPMARDALIGPLLSDQLAGVFAVTNGTQIATGRGSALFSIVGQVVPEAEQVIATPFPTEGPVAVSMFGPPVWLPSIFILSGVFALFLIAIVIARSLARRRESRIGESLKEEDDESNSA